MYCIKYRIKNIAPLVISTTYGDMNMVTTERYIPGSSILGILVKQYLKNNNLKKDAHKDKDFYNWFLAGDIIISNAYIFSSDRNNNNYVHYPVPFSIQREKTSYDTIDLLFTEADGKLRKTVDAFCFLDEEILQKKDVETALNFHHARDREKGIPKEELIFNYEAIVPEQVFEGRICGKREDLEELLKICGIKWTAFVGRSKNAQYGEAVFEILDRVPQPFHVDIDDAKEITLTLLSNTIVYSEFGFSTTDKTNLENHLGVKIKKAFIKKGQIENFVGVWQLKKPSETCFLAGSTFLLDISNIDKKKLAELQINGIGERRHEGFGQCRLGWQKEMRLTIYKEAEEESFNSVNEPSKPVPGTTRNILVSLVKNHFKKQAELIALNEQQSFDHGFSKLTPSLLGRLEAMAKNKNRDKFTANLNLLRKPAKDKLEQCNNGKENLLKFLLKKDITVSDVLQTPVSANLKRMCEEISYTPEQDDDLNHLLYPIYMMTFFSTMRKNLKTKA